MGVLAMIADNLQPITSGVGEHESLSDKQIWRKCAICSD